MDDISLSSLDQSDIAMLSAQLLNGQTVQYIYETTGNPGPFQVGLYRSADGVTYDAASPIATQTVTPSPRNPQTPGAFPLPSGFAANPTKPYLVVVADPNNAIAEADEGNNEASVALPTVKIDINGTSDQTDDITLFDPGIVAQAIPARITNIGVIPVAVQLTAGAAASLDQTTLSLGVGASADIALTPRAVSQSVNDVIITATAGNIAAGSEDMTIVSVVLPQHVRYGDTPPQMPDRIPPRAMTPVTIQISPNLGASGQLVNLSVIGQTENDGAVTVDANAERILTSTTSVALQGVTQTASNYAGNLRLAVRVRGETAAWSEGFSVSAIPVGFHQTASRLLSGGVLQFDYSWQSDSGDLSDLSQIWIGEHVVYSDGGVHEGPGRPWQGNNPDPTITPGRVPNGGGLPIGGKFTDTHSPPGGILPRPGLTDSYSATQNYGFHDFRTDSRPMDDTLGWQIDVSPTIVIARFVEFIRNTSPPLWQYRIEKNGVTNTAPLSKGSGSSNRRGAGDDIAWMALELIWDSTVSQILAHGTRGASSGLDDLQGTGLEAPPAFVED